MKYQETWKFKVQRLLVSALSGNLQNFFLILRAASELNMCIGLQSSRIYHILMKNQSFFFFN